LKAERLSEGGLRKQTGKKTKLSEVVPFILFSLIFEPTPKKVNYRTKYF